MTTTNNDSIEQEVTALKTVYTALSGLESKAQRWVIRTVADRLGISDVAIPPDASGDAPDSTAAPRAEADLRLPQQASGERRSDEDATETGISPVAQKWMARSGLSRAGLSTLYSLDFEDIDLIASSIPGGSKRSRMRNVLLLKALASYLASGAVRVTLEKAKEACLHYNAYDENNFWGNLKEFAKEMSGSKAAGITLTPSGLAEATSLVQSMLKSQDDDAPGEAKRRPRGRG